MECPSLLSDSGDQTPSIQRRLYSSLKQPSVLFRTMLTNIADQLTAEEVNSLAYIHSIGKSGRDPNERPTALDVLRSLEMRGIFSLDCLEPLEGILDGIHRHDLVNTVVMDFKVKMRGKRRSHWANLKVLCFTCVGRVLRLLLPTSHCAGIRRAESEPVLRGNDLPDCEPPVSPSLQTYQVYIHVHNYVCTKMGMTNYLMNFKGHDCLYY